MAPPAATLLEQFAKGWRGYVLIALIALVSSLFGAGRMQVMDADEARFAQATRQMIETGDFVRIRFQEEERNRKPVGVHWLQAAAVQALAPATQGLNRIWPYRLPSALGIVLAAVAALWAGRALVGETAALFGAGLFAAGMLAGFEGMTAKSDALLLGFSTLAMAALARLYLAQAPDGRAAALLFWASMACAILIKGPVAPLLAFLTLASLALWERRWRWMQPLLWWPGPALAALLLAPWSIAITAATEGRFFADMLFGDIVPKLIGGEDSHFALPGYHLFLLPFLIFPATYALPAAARVAFEALRAPRADAATAGLRFLIAWAAPLFIFFELAATKLAHYPLPTYPAIALLCGAGLAAIDSGRWRTAHPAGVVLYAVYGAVIVALMAATATFLPGDFAADLRRAVSTALIGLGLLALSFTVLIMAPRAEVRAAVLIACALALSFSLRERLLPEARALNVSTEAVAALTRARLTPRDDRALWVVGYSEPSIVFLTRTTTRLADAAEIGASGEIGDAVIAEGRALQDLAAALEQRDLAFAPSEPPVRGLALGRGERVALFVGQIAPISDDAADAPEPDP